MGLDVTCGCAGRVKVERKNSLTGEITGVFEFDNIWTDYGLARLSGWVSGSPGVVAYWPSYLHYGSGQHAAPHNGVTRLAARIGAGAWGGTSNATYPDLDTVLVTRTASITVAARGVAWQLYELGVSTDTGASANLDTYTLTKVGGVVAPIDVAAIEILTITYTVQIQYPRRLPPQPVDISGDMVPTMATFTIPGTAANYARDSLRGMPDLAYAARIFLSAAQDGGVVPSYTSTTSKFGSGLANRNNGAYGLGINDLPRPVWIFTFDPPITKANTQELELTSYWTFTNGTYREP